MPRICLDAPSTVGHAHLKSIQAHANYGMGTSTNDMLIVAVIVMGIVLIGLTIALYWYGVRRR